VEAEDFSIENETQVEIAALFRDRLGAVPTESFLRDPKLVSIVSPLIQKHAQNEVATLEQRMSVPCPIRNDMGQLRMAFTNIALDGFAGSELWTLEMASYMHRSAVPTIVYSPHLGAVAEKFAIKGFEITDDLGMLEAFAPTVLHTHHQQETAQARIAVGPNCRQVNMIHGLLPHPEWPGADMDAYVAVSLHAKAKTALLGPPGWDDITLMPNFFDPKRFGNKQAERRSNALLHSSRVTDVNIRQMQGVLEQHGLTLDHIGYGGTVEASPEMVLPQYNVVFAAGRSAIEALASGCHVILWDQGIVGPAITTGNFWYVLAANFSVASCILPFVMADDPAMEKWLAEQLLLLENPMPLQALVHEYLTVDVIGARMLAIYDSLSNRASGNKNFAPHASSS
jgi:hypothetical protein